VSEQPAPEETGDPIDIAVQMIVPPKLITRVTAPGVEIEVRITTDQGFDVIDEIAATLPQCLDAAWAAAAAAQNG
jgi:hypothetical protein